MSDNYKAQVSIKFGAQQAGMLNLRADSVEELEQLIDQTIPAMIKMGGLVEETTALNTVGAAFPGTQPATQPQGNYQQQAPVQQGTAQSCPHGPMQWKEGPDWKGYFCPAQRTDPTKCKARYIR